MLFLFVFCLENELSPIVCDFLFFYFYSQGSMFVLCDIKKIKKIKKIEKIGQRVALSAKWSSHNARGCLLFCGLRDLI